MKILAGFSILFVCLLLISAIPTVSALEIINVEGEHVNEQVKVTLDKSAFVISRMNNGTPIYAQGEEVYFIPRVKGAVYIDALAGEERATGFVSIVEKPSDDSDDSDGGGKFIKLDICHAYKLPGDIFHRYIIFSSGMTVLDALKEANESKGFGYEYEAGYVSSIDGHKEKDEGPLSGWMYWVNYPEENEPPNIPCNDYKLRSGDEVIWYWVTKPNTVPPTTTPGDRDGGGGGISPTPTPMPVQIVNETKKIESIEAGENASVTFEKTDITRIVINANNTIRNATITIQQIEKLANITNVSGMSYCYFNITTTNLTNANITNATIEFRVNKTGLNESNIDETTITLNRYSDISGNWSALPTSKIKEDNASLYFESETSSFSLFVISGEEKTAPLSTETETGASEATVTPTPTTSSPSPSVTPLQKSSLMGKWEIIVIGCIITALIIVFVNIYYRKKRRKE